MFVAKCYRGLFAEFMPSSAVCRSDSDKQRLSQQRVANSANVLAMIGELTCSLTRQIASKSEELRRLNDLVDSMQVLWAYLFTVTVKLLLLFTQATDCSVRTSLAAKRVTRQFNLLHLYKAVHCPFAPV